jgi:hypothetical protein
MFCTSFRLATAGATASLGLLLAAPAIADDDTGFYVGANVGRVLSTYRRASLDDAVTGVFGTSFDGSSTGFAIGTSSVKKDRVMWSADVGYMLSRNVGIEASYLNLGSLRYSSFGTQPSASGSGTSQVIANVDIKSHGPALALLGVLPMSNLWEVDARVGAYEGKTSSTYYSAVDANTNAGRLSKSSTSLLVGVGTGLTLTNHCVARLDYMRIEHINEQLFGHSFNVDMLTVGFAYVF